MKALINTKPKHYGEYTFIVTDEKYPIDLKFKKTVGAEKINAISKCKSVIAADIEIASEIYKSKTGETKSKPVIWVSDFKINSRTAEPPEFSTELPF